MTQAGQFTKRVTIEKPTLAVSDGAGGWSNDSEFEIVKPNVWANVEQLSGRRLLEFGAIAFVSAWQIKLYKDNAEGIDTSCKLIYNNKRLTIHSIIDEDEEGWELTILAYATET